MSEANHFLVFIRKLNALGVRYMVTGSIAGVGYGEPRVTHDVDIVRSHPRRLGRARAAAQWAVIERTG